MGDAIGEVLPAAVAVAISPVPVTAVILMLLSRRAATNSLAFLGGWLLGLAAVGAIVLSLGDVFSSDGGASTTSGVVKLAIGALFVGMAARNWRNRPREGEEPQVPGWLEAIDDFTVPRSFGVALALSAVNPKNLGLTVAATSSIAAAELGGGEQAAVFALFLLIACSTVAGPVAYYAFDRDRAQGTLDRLKAWLIADDKVIMAVLLLVIGAKLLGDGISILSG
jgi:threonine/homoserine/homoserine lactone efflux protein